MSSGGREGTGLVAPSVLSTRLRRTRGWRRARKGILPGSAQIFIRQRDGSIARTATTAAATTAATTAALSAIAAMAAATETEQQRELLPAAWASHGAAAAACDDGAAATAAAFHEEDAAMHHHPQRQHNPCRPPEANINTTDNPPPQRRRQQRLRWQLRRVSKKRNPLTCGAEARANSSSRGPSLESLGHPVKWCSTTSG